MHIKIEDMLKLEEFKGAVIVAGAKGLKNKVNNAAVMEVPDIFPYI